MAIIPRFTSRALPPGAQPGLIESAQRRGRAGAGLADAFGDTIVAGVKYKQRKDAADAVDEAYRAQTLNEINEDLGKIGDSIEGFVPFRDLDTRPLPDGWSQRCMAVVRLGRVLITRLRAGGRIYPGATRPSQWVASVR